MKRLFIALLLLLPWSALAAPEQMDDFAILPVLDGGRLKPLDSFARELLHNLSGHEQLAGRSAVAWLASVLFRPEDAAQTPLFALATPTLRTLFNLTGRRDPLFSLAELAPGLAATAAQAEAISRKTAAARTPDEQALMDAHTHVLQFNQLLQTLSLVLPLPGDADGATYLARQQDEVEATDRLREVVKLKGPDPENYTDAEQALLDRGFALQKLRAQGERNVMVRLIPSLWEPGNWLSPWQLVLDGRTTPASTDYLRRWQAMAAAYRADDETAWAQATAAARQTAARLMHPDEVRRLGGEVFYNHAQLYAWAAALYLLAALVGLRWLRLAPWLLLGGIFVHGFALGLRIYLLARPPVGTLYESALFVSLIIAAAAFLAGLRTRQRLPLGAGALGAVMVLLAAPWLQPGGENLGVLTAVLNTNLWLTIHVLTITAGYGLCLLTAAVAHGLLHQGGKVTPLLMRLTVVSLLLITTGTFLGGIWADQSWGRFWGWDPKENGALLILLWLLWVLHGRLSGHLQGRNFTAMLALLAIVVALAWFGVNLLGVGLHSYGFISGIAMGLGGFISIELLLVLFLWQRAGPRQDA